MSETDSKADLPFLDFVATVTALLQGTRCPFSFRYERTSSNDSLVLQFEASLPKQDGAAR